MEEVKSNDVIVDVPIKQEPIDFLSRMVESHDKVSREVTKEDIPRVVDEAKVLYNLCFTVNKGYQGGYALAHPQIDDKDPLRFFVTHKKEIIINPKMVRHTRHAVDSKEGCLSFPHLTPKIIDRYHRSEFEYQGIKDDVSDLTPIALAELSGRESFVWQHETDHLDAKYIYAHDVNQTNIKKIDAIIKEGEEELKAKING